MTYLFDDKIRYDDSPNIDAFGGLRVSNSRILGEYRFQYGVATSIAEFNTLTATSGTIVSDFPRNCYLLNTTTASGSRAVMQSKQYHPYISGTSNKYLMTFKMDTAKANLKQSVGAFDDYNGIFFRMNGTTPEVVIRKAGVDTEVVSKANWNKDRLDGSMNEFNQSGITADFTKCQILFIDYQWLGVGRVRIGFVLAGVPVIVHQFEHANQTVETYIRQPSLPVRYEIANSDTVASTSQLMAICSSVYCEGADSETGYNRSVSTDGTSISVTSSTDGQLILAIRLKNGQFGGHYNHALARLKDWALFSNNDMQYKVIILPTATGFINGTPTWSAVPGKSICEYTKNAAMVSGWQTAQAGNYDVLVDGFVQGAVGSGSGTNAIREADNKKNAIYQNYDATDSEVIAIVGYKLTNNADIKAGMIWLEVK